MTAINPDIAELGVDQAAESPSESKSLLEHFVNAEFKVTEESGLNQEDRQFITDYPERYIATLSSVELQAQGFKNYYEVLPPSDTTSKGYLARQVHSAFIKQGNKYYVDVSELITALISNAEDIKLAEKYLIVKKNAKNGKYELSIYSRKPDNINYQTGRDALAALVTEEGKREQLSAAGAGIK